MVQSALSRSHGLGTQQTGYYTPVLPQICAGLVTLSCPRLEYPSPLQKSETSDSLAFPSTQPRSQNMNLRFTIDDLSPLMLAELLVLMGVVRSLGAYAACRNVERSLSGDRTYSTCLITTNLGARHAHVAKLVDVCSSASRKHHIIVWTSPRFTHRWRTLNQMCHRPLGFRGICFCLRIRCSKRPADQRRSPCQHGQCEGGEGTPGGFDLALGTELASQYEATLKANMITTA